MTHLAVYGAGGQGRELLLLVQQMNRHTPTWTIAGFFDDGVSTGTIINGFPVLGNLATLNQWPDSLAVVVAIGQTSVKRSVVERINNPAVWFPTLIHPSVQLTPDNFTTIGEGSVLCAGTTLTTNIAIGKHVLINRNCTIGHDAVLADFCAIMPGVTISGDVILSEGVYVGTGATLSNQVSVCVNTIIGAGAVVTQSLPPNCTAVGVPARPIRFH